MNKECKFVIVNFGKPNSLYNDDVPDILCEIEDDTEFWMSEFDDNEFWYHHAMFFDTQKEAEDFLNSFVLPNTKVNKEYFDFTVMQARSKMSWDLEPIKK